MDRRWKTADITDEMVCRAYLPQMERREREREAEKHLTLGDILDQAFRRSLDASYEPEEFADGVLIRETGAPPKVVEAALYRACERNLIDCGVTVRSGWLTEKGKALLAAARESTDDRN